MTTPLAPPVLADEPAERIMALADALAQAARELGTLAEMEWCELHDVASVEWHRARASLLLAVTGEANRLSAENAALLAQARQGREDAERLREALEVLRVGASAIPIDSEASNALHGVIDEALRAATPSPSPEGGR